jgi:hypothetical protein
MSRNRHKAQHAPVLAENEALIVQNTEGGYSLLRDFGVSSSATQWKAAPKADEQVLSEFPNTSHTSTWQWARWGSDDKYPLTTIQKLNSVPIAGRVMRDRIKLAYGEGMRYEGNTVSQKPAIETFLKNNKPIKVLPTAYGHYYRHNFVPVVYTLDGNRKIAKIEILDPVFCRYAVQNKETLRIDTLLYSKKFSTPYTKADEDIIALPILDEWDTEGFLTDLKTDKFAMIIQGESPAMLYYPLQPWAGLLKEGGWLDVSADIPTLIRSIHKNQISIKYKIGVDEERFTQMYGDAWRRNDFTFEGKTKKQLRDIYWDEIEKALTGSENAGKSIKYIFKTDPMTGRPLGNIVIEPVDDKMKQGQYIPNSQAADQQIVQALEGDVSMVGLQGMDTALGGNSGSKQRVGYNQAIAMNTLDQDTVLQIYNFVSEVNGWDVEFEHYHYEMTTTDNDPKGIRPMGEDL